MEPVKLKSCLKRIKERVDLKEHQIINVSTRFLKFITISHKSL